MKHFCHLLYFKREEVLGDPKVHLYPTMASFCQMRPSSSYESEPRQETIDFSSFNRQKYLTQTLVSLVLKNWKGMKKIPRIIPKVSTVGSKRLPLNRKGWGYENSKGLRRCRELEFTPTSGEQGYLGLVSLDSRRSLVGGDLHLWGGGTSFLVSVLEEVTVRLFL